MEPSGPPPPWVLGPALPSPPSLVPAPVLTKHEGAAATACAGAAVLPRSRGGTKVSTPAPKKTGEMKKTSDVQPPEAPLQPAAAPTTPTSAQEAIVSVAMDDAQQMLEESPARFVFVFFSFCIVRLLLQMRNVVLNVLLTTVELLQFLFGFHKLV